jgi:hypothetical protein
MPCPNNTNETCGGANANSIYQIVKSCFSSITTTPPTPTTTTTTWTSLTSKTDITNDTTSDSTAPSITSTADNTTNTKIHFTTTTITTSTKTTSTTRKTTTKLPLIYIGCYGDGYERALNGSYAQIGSVNPCVAYCYSKGFLYAGLQNG